MTATPTSSGTRGLSDKNQIKKLYLDYDAHSDDAQDLGSAQWHKYLSQWTTDPLLQVLINGLENQRKKHLRVLGQRVPHISSIRIRGDKAVLHDCSDLSHVDVKNTKTGDLVDDYPKDMTWTTAKLKKTKSGWLIYASDAEFESCSGR